MKGWYSIEKELTANMESGEQTCGKKNPDERASKIATVLITFKPFSNNETCKLIAFPTEHIKVPDIMNYETCEEWVERASQNLVVKLLSFEKSTDYNDSNKRMRFNELRVSIDNGNGSTISIVRKRDDLY